MKDYEHVGFKCGIEIHQRLATKEKLFCSCNPYPSEKEHKKEIIRKLRTVPGELGEVDIAALYEFLRARKFIYHTFDKESCLVEADEEPPHSMNMEALMIGLIIAKLLECDIPDEIHVMRKTVIDGSNTGGFQRTALVGLNGKLKTSSGIVRITNVSIEEESAGIVNQEGTDIIYKLDRLGIPLVEIGTAPDIKDPEHAKEVAEKIGMLLRSTKVQRGIGTIRQDVNVSIKDGARIEIKGMQELDMIPETIRREVMRQISLIELKSELNKKGVTVSEVTDATTVFKETENKIIKNELQKNGKILALKLSGFAGLLSKELCQGKTLGSELADYARAYGVKGLIHTDEDLEKYGLSDEFENLRSLMGANNYDTLLIIAGKENAEKAIKAVQKRARLLLENVPEETRIATPEGTTRYARPLPGGERMYPETDIPPIIVDKKLLSQIKLPETWEQKAIKFSKILPKDMIEPMLRSEYLKYFEEFSSKYDPVLVANTLLSTVKDLKRDEFKTDRLEQRHFADVFEAVSKKQISKEGIPEVLKIFTEIPELSIQEAINRSGLIRISVDELDKIIDKVFKANNAFVIEKNFSALMGLIMKEARGKIDGATVSERLKKKLF